MDAASLIALGPPSVSTPLRKVERHRVARSLREGCGDAEPTEEKARFTAEATGGSTKVRLLLLVDGVVFAGHYGRMPYEANSCPISTCSINAFLMSSSPSGFCCRRLAIPRPKSANALRGLSRKAASKSA